MTIARITTPGLAAMGVSVTLLWSCLIGERVLMRNAAHEQTRLLHEMNLLRQKQRSEPASAPLPVRPHRPQAAKG